MERKQVAHMEESIVSCDGENIVLQVEFSGNPTIKMRNKIQSAHWNHFQATLFPVHAWITATPSESIVIVSDDLTYNKYIVYVFMKSVIENLLAKHLEIKLINIFSDGARIQFKQKVYTLQLATMGICFKYKAYIGTYILQLPIEWIVVDGLGGSFKRSYQNSRSHYFQYKWIYRPCKTKKSKYWYSMYHEI